MNKEEILARSRQEKHDEGMTMAENQGRKFGLMAFCVIFMIVILCNLAKGHSNYAPFAMFWAFLAAEAYPKYVFTKQKSYLLSTIFGAIASLGFLASFILTTVIR